MKFNPSHERKLNRKIKQFQYINVPFLVASGALIYTPLLKMLVAAEKYEMISRLLTVADFMLFFDSFMIFGLVSKIVTSIVYKPKE